MNQTAKASIAVGLALVVSMSIYRIATREKTHTPLPAVAFREDLIRTQEVARYKKAAASGDCHAKLELAHYYNEGPEYQYDEAMRWYRLAARCPGIKAKSELVGWLAVTNPKGQNVAEIEALMVEIEKLDPKEAADLRRRYQKNNWDLDASSR
jgi:TPR repeat protein